MPTGIVPLRPAANRAGPIIVITAGDGAQASTCSTATTSGT
jgi:hypothetical protein